MKGKKGGSSFTFLLPDAVAFNNAIAQGVLEAPYLLGEGLEEAAELEVRMAGPGLGEIDVGQLVAATEADLKKRGLTPVADTASLRLP